MSDASKPQISLTVEQLKELLLEIKKPAPPTEAEQLKIDSVIEQRRQLSLAQRNEAENRKRMRLSCSHMRRDNTARTVLVKGSGGAYLLCQKCQGIIRHGVAPKVNYRGDIYNSEMFNRLFQLSTQGNVSF